MAVIENKHSCAVYTFNATLNFKFCEYYMYTYS